MKIRLQIIGLGGVILSLALLGIGVGAMHLDKAAIPAGIAFVVSVFLKCLGDGLK